MWQKITLLLSVTQVIHGIVLPASFKRCKVSPNLDNLPNACLKDAIENAIQQLAGGNSQLSALPLDPLTVDRIFMDQSSSSSIPIKLTLIDTKLGGFKNLKLQHINGKLSSPDNFALSGQVVVPSLTLIGKYDVSGSVISLPITGAGESNLNLDGIVADFNIKATSTTKGNEKYLKITSFKLTLSKVSKMTMHLSNLFNGNAILGDNMNKFINENWNDIYQELKPSIQSAFGAIFEEYTKRIFEQIPFSEIFLS